MKILVTGSSGLIGSAVSPSLAAKGHTVIALSRDAGTSPSWNPTTGAIDPKSIDAADAVIHLAGANIGAKRWTKARKRVILDSRVGPTTALAKSLAQLDNPPSTFVVASAIGYYGDRDDEWLDESSTAGVGFLADVVQQWEHATTPAAARGIRVVNLRFGVILTPEGGALKRMLPPFKLGLGGPIGSGKQYMSWVGLEDVIGAIEHVLTNPPISGPVNVVAPNPVTNREFADTLGHVLSRPAFLPLPAFALRILLGEMADELLLYSAHVRPTKLTTSGYPFRGTNLEESLLRMLDR